MHSIHFHFVDYLKSLRITSTIHKQYKKKTLIRATKPEYFLLQRRSMNHTENLKKITPFAKKKQEAIFAIGCINSQLVARPADPRKHCHNKAASLFLPSLIFT